VYHIARIPIFPMRQALDARLGPAHSFLPSIAPQDLNRRLKQPFLTL
jgi:hypothetical protein